MRQLISQTEFKFKILLKSSLMIASLETASINVGGIDSLIARNPVDDKPLIPPSSLYGKLRYLYEITKKVTDKDTAYYFGSAQAIEPSMINIKSIELLSHDTDSFTLKAENTISRLTLEARPRLLQPAKRGMEVVCTVLINLYDCHSETPENVINDVLMPLRKNLEYDYIGGCGTRGFGEVDVYIEDETGQWKRISGAFTTTPVIKTCSTKSTIEIDETEDLKEETVYLNAGFFSDNQIQSSTIAGLFAYALANMGREGLIEHIYNGKDFLVSSAFPAIALKDEIIHYFPRPLVYVNGLKTHNNKKLYLYEFEYMSESLLSSFFADNSILFQFCDELDKNYFIKDHLLMSKGEYEKIKNLNPFNVTDFKLSGSADLIHVSIDPHNGFPKIDEKTGRGILFSTLDHCYSEHYKFFFLVRHKFKDISPIFHEIERLGIGRDKSAGMGYFKFEIKPDCILKHVNPSGSRYFSLSLIHPDNCDRNQLSAETSKNSFYSVITRKGKRENNSFTGAGDFRYEKDKIFMFKEGSIFSFPIKGSSPVVYSKCEEGYEIRDFGYIYSIRF